MAARQLDIVLTHLVPGKVKKDAGAANPLSLLVWQGLLRRRGLMFIRSRFYAFSLPQPFYRQTPVPTTL